MKKEILIFCGFLMLISYKASAQYTWQQKNNFLNFPRAGGIAFSVDTNGDGIPDKAFAGLGEQGAIVYSDLWQYDPVNDIWTQMADLTGGQRGDAIGFAIDSMGYVGGGNPVSGTAPYNDFWQYNPTKNTWVKKSNLPGGTGRWGAFAIGVNHKGYFGFGAITQEYSSIQNDLWEYDPIGDSWNLLNSFPSTSRLNPVGFSLDTNTIYVGTGWDGNENTNDIWAYSISSNSWVQKQDLPGSPRLVANAFAIAGKGFLGLGSDGDESSNFTTNFLNDFYEYDPLTNNWTSISNLTDIGRADAMAFTIGSNGYVMCGGDSLGINNDVYELVTPGVSVTINATICRGETYDGYNLSGTYVDTFIIANGVDSIRTLNLIVLPSYHIDDSVIICAGQSYQGYNFTGYYVDSLSAVNGCDSIYSLHLTVLPKIITNVNQTICNGQAYDGYDSSGIYVDTFISINGCDSIRILNLAVSTYNTRLIKTSICEGDTFEGHTTQGIFYDTIPSFSGCDTITTLELNITPRSDIPVIVQYGNRLLASAADKYQWYVGNIALADDTEQSLIITYNGKYSVEVWDSTVCGTTSAPLFAYLAGIDQTNSFENNITLSPNPNNGQFTINFDQNISGQTELSLQDITGRVIWHQNFVDLTPGNIAIDPGPISKGIYIFMVRVAGNQITKKLVVE